jgi:hypothetical protein
MTQPIAVLLYRSPPVSYAFYVECAFYVVYDPYGFRYGLDYAAAMAWMLG